MDHAVGTGHGHADLRPGGGTGGGGVGHGGDHAVINGVRHAAINHVHHFAVHAQQEQRGIADLESAHGGQFISCGGGADGIGGRAHGDGGGSRRAG
ncbi:hypothetical protein SDC9_153761 [bioreactor metagenome]|uniref:Uncharacterized protein n=1 Tax=bioreactor metagenome TaxID=1076179 RepID=A0A645EWV1_9ZZZZ